MGRRGAGLTGPSMLAYLEGKAERSPSGCLLWTGTKDKKSGRGVVGYEGRMWPVAGLAYRLRHGPPTDGKRVTSRCGNPACFADAHLFAGGRSDALQVTGLKGEQHGRAKLSEANVRAIREDHRGGAVVAAEYGVSSATISNIRHGRTWQHI